MFVSNALRSTNRPVVIWGVPIPEFGIVNGVEEDKYIVSTLRRVLGQPDDPVRYDKIEAPGGVMKIVFKNQVEAPERKDADYQALVRAIDIAEGKYVEPGYVMGPEAMGAWAENLTGEGALYGGNAYVGACTEEAFAWAEMFFLRMAKRYEDEPQCGHLNQAANEFDKARGIMNDFSSLFPMSWERYFKNGDREEGAKLLPRAKDHFDTAIDHMRNALKAWE